jgi:hypothetical protein
MIVKKHPQFNLSRIVTGLAIASGMATVTPIVSAQQSAVLEEIIVTARKAYEPL